MNFKLKKIKIDADGNVNMIYVMHDPETAQSKEEHDVTCDRVPHPDLTDAIKKLQHHLADANGLLIKPENSKTPPKRRELVDAPEMQKVFEQLNEEIVESVHVSGVSIQGADDSMSVVITGKHEVHHTAVAMNSPKINLNGDSFGFEVDVDEIIHEIIIEARAYVVERKSAQLEMDLKVA